MEEDFRGLSKDEQLKAENDFIKMKLMLQHGAEFGEGEEKIPPEIENMFLNNVMEFEKQFHERKTISVFDKIGRPGHFQPVTEIGDEQIEQAWESLCEHLLDHGIELSAASPNITSRELYRFTTEELILQETDDLNIPGMMTCFIYDEFHPDPVFEAGRAVEHFMYEVFTPEPLHKYFHCMKDSAVTLNGKTYDNVDKIKSLINSFKSEFSELELKNYDVSVQNILENGVVVINGNYQSVYSAKGDTNTELNGTFSFTISPGEDKYYQIEKLELVPALF